MHSTNRQKSGISLFSHIKGNKGPCLRRPLLVLLDRDIDLVAALEHTSHYQVSESEASEA